MGNMQEKQDEMAKKLKEIKLKHEGDGFIIEVNAAKEVLNVELPKALMNADGQEELQDLLIVQLNRALEKAEEAQAKESSSMINDLLPGGLGGMFGG